MSDDDKKYSDSDEFEDFYDAEEAVPIKNTNISFYQALEETHKAIDHFFNNEFTEAISITSPRANTSMYHALSDSIFAFLDGVLTFEEEIIKNALVSLKNSANVANQYRKKRTFSESLEKIVKKENLELITQEEAHAELCYAESLLLKSLLTLVKDETLASFIKAGIGIKSCYNSYKDCYQILLNKNWDKDPTKHEFEGGVMAGIGGFNLMISMLPSRAIKLLQIFGFSADKQKGLEDIVKGCSMEGVRQMLCMSIFLIYNLAVIPVLTHREGDVKLCEEMVEKKLKKYPKSVWFLFFKGRIRFLYGKFQESQDLYVEAWKSQNSWTQFHHICFWELMWVHLFKLEWKEALQYISQLIIHSKWSRTIYSYIKAAILLMMKDNLTKQELEEINVLMEDVPKYKKKIAGKSLPMEKFVVKKAKRYFSQNCNLLLPVVELMFLFNLFKVLKDFSMANKLLKLVEKIHTGTDFTSISNKYSTDNKALVLLLQGALLRQIGSPLQAIEYFESVIEMKTYIVDDNYIVPYAIVELALTEWSNGNQEKAILALEDVKKNYSGYSLESRLHFKIHTALIEFKNEIKNKMNFAETDYSDYFDLI